nr:immunoglobulin heavy chain junction region [Mus musculus]
ATYFCAREFGGSSP